MTIQYPRRIVTNITVVKCDHHGQELIRYEGDLLSEAQGLRVLRAVFSFSDVQTDYVRFAQGDWLIEHFFTDRWYNIFELHSSIDGALKGWYCNLARPARFGPGLIWQDDLALDLWIDPARQTRVLDLEEFEALPLSDDERMAALKGLAELEAMAQAGVAPFID